MGDAEKMALYLERVNREHGIDGARAHAAGRVVGWHLFWFLVALALVITALSLGQCATAHAQDAEATACDDGEEHTAPRRLRLTQSGEGGWWFRGDVARCLLGDVTELRLLRDRVALFDQRLEIRDGQLAAVREAVTLAVAAQERAVAVVAVAGRRARTAEEDARRERDLRWVWVVGSVAVVLALEVVAVWALGQLRI